MGRWEQRAEGAPAGVEQTSLWAVVVVVVVVVIECDEECDGNIWTISPYK